MVDTLTPAQRSERMSRIKGKNTSPELLVRQLVHGMGYRYRLHAKHLPGKPDMVFPGRKKAIFIHGCFWHRHPDPSCKLARLPKSKQEFWVAKLEGNRKRDMDKEHKLLELGWNILVIWECELRDNQSLQTKIRKFLDHEVD